MEGVQELYKKFGVLADAKEEEHEEEYLSILATVSTGSNAEKRLCASFIPRFFPSFPSHQEKAVNSQLDLCEEADPMVRREAIKGLPDLCKGDSSLVSRMADVLTQLLQTEDHLEQTIVRHCLVQLIKQELKGAIGGIVNQVITGDEVIRGRALKFLFEKLENHSPQLNSDKELKEYVLGQLELVCDSVTQAEFTDMMGLVSSLDSDKAAQLVIKQTKLDAIFDPAKTECIEKFCTCVRLGLQYMKKADSAVLKYYSSSVLPVFSQIESVSHKLQLLQVLSEVLSHTVSEEDAAVCLDNVHTVLLSYLPETPPGDEEDVEEPPELEFSVLECLLFSLHRVASQVPDFLGDETRIADLKKRLTYCARCCSCYTRRLKSSSIGEDPEDKLKLKTTAFKSINNVMMMIKDIFRTPIVYKSEIVFSWKVDLANVKRPLPAAAKQTAVPASKKRRSGTMSSGREQTKSREQQVYAPPQGRYSSNIAAQRVGGRSEGSSRRRY